MTRDVLITISDAQMMDEENSNVGVIIRGDYYQRNGKHYILYGEVVEGLEGKAKSVIKISPVGMDIIKKGIANTHIRSEENKKNLSRYTAPLGDMVVGIQTNKIKIEKQPDNLKVDIDYSLDINHEHLSDCSIRLDAQPCASSYAQMSAN